MRFNFDYIIDLEPPDMRTIQIGNNPSNALVQYYIGGQNLSSRSAQIVVGNYEGIVFSDEQPRVTANKVSRFGIKSLVGLGAHGYYRDMNGKSSLFKSPIN